MRAIVGNQVVEMEPVLMTEGGFSIEATKPAPDGKGRVYVKHNGEIVWAGVTFYAMDKDSSVDPLTGRYQLRGRSSKIRAVFMGQHLEIGVRQ